MAGISPAEILQKRQLVAMVVLLSGLSLNLIGRVRDSNKHFHYSLSQNVYDEQPLPAYDIQQTAAFLPPNVETPWRVADF